MILTRAFFITATLAGAFRGVNAAPVTSVVTSSPIVREDAGCRQAGCLRAVFDVTSSENPTPLAMLKEPRSMGTEGNDLSAAEVLTWALAEEESNPT
ncbi:hypothetical protein L226DRAFT_538925 [Lentinus tigrinus ALCF2SS1-7]|nr:hypothetical protein L226DRAFT_538925 [Lentinus tigrinus ALCF2SS1-7]